MRESIRTTWREIATHPESDGAVSQPLRPLISPSFNTVYHPERRLP